MKANNHDNYCIQSVDNALLLLEAISESDHDVQLSRLCKQLGFSKSMTFRLLNTFQRRGYLEQKSDPHRYQLGIPAFELAKKCLLRMPLIGKAHPVMEELAQKTQESIYLAVRQGEEMLLIDLVDSPQQVKVMSLVGRRFPLANTAAGKIFDHYEKRDTGKAINLEEISAIHRNGYSSAEEDIARGVISLAAPLLDDQQRALGALLMVIPDFRLQTDQQRGQQGERLTAACETISSKLCSFKNYRYAQGA